MLKKSIATPSFVKHLGIFVSFCYDILMDRQQTIVWTSIIGIITNVVLVGFKLLVGIMAGSIAIILDAVNNLTDVLSSVVTIVGTKLAARQPDDGHPYGHGRIEYLTTLLVGAIIFGTGVMALFEAVPKIIHPVLANYNAGTIIVVAAAILTKLVLGSYVRRIGHKLNSGSLLASGLDALFDALLSFSTLVGIIVTMAFHVSIDGILGAFIALFIMRTSLSVLREASNQIVGQTADAELQAALTSLIKSHPEVKSVHELMLHNYGPNDFIGSVQIQVPDQLTAREIHDLTHQIARQVRRKYGVKLTVGIRV